MRRSSSVSGLRLTWVTLQSQMSLHQQPAYERLWLKGMVSVVFPVPGGDPLQKNEYIGRSGKHFLQGKIETEVVLSKEDEERPLSEQSS